MAEASANQKVRIGFVGVGQIGKAHLDTYQKIPSAEIVAVCDANEAEARRVAEKYHVPNVYTDFRKLLARDDIQAVDVCLHNNLHSPVTCAALQAGKDVYCEKPMAGSYVDAKLMYDTAKTLNRKLGIQLSTLFSAETRVAKKLIDAGQLGQLYHARSTGFRRRGRPFVDGYGSATFVQKHNSAGGALYDMGVYHIAAMLYLLGNPPPQRISGKAYQKTALDRKRQQESGYDVEELGVGFVRFGGDMTLDLIEAWAIHLDNFEGSTVVGTDGGIRLNPFGFFRCVADVEMNSTVNLDGARYRWANVNQEGGVYDGPQQHWIAALQGRVPLLPTAELALNTMLISEGIYLSDRLGREVTAAEVLENSRSSALKL
jgi:predicted dehydrogenase